MNKFLRPALFSAALMLASSLTFAQEKCAAWTNLQKEINESPEAKQQFDQWQQSLEKYIKDNKGKPKNGEKRIIPVVVHVIHEYGDENISREQIVSQIESLNKDFSLRNDNMDSVPAHFRSLAANCNIEFRLATKDDMGNCSDGIVRVYSPKTTDASNLNKVKALSYWNSSKYLNIWVVKSIDNGANMGIPGQVLGYAQFPYNITRSGLMSTDGVVLRSDCTGNVGTAASNKRKGTTATHEVGHWLGLRHIWGDAECGNDFVDDTPIAFGPNFGICWKDYPYHVTGKYNCGRPASDTTGEMFMNFMDYTDDDCMAIFTKGQLEVMDATLSTFRRNLWSAENLEATGTRDEDVANPTPCSPVADFSDNRSLVGALSYEYAMICEGANVMYKNTSYKEGANPSRSWEFEGGSPETSTLNQVTVTYPNAGIYDVKLSVSNSAGSSELLRKDYVIVSSKTADHDNSSYYEGFEQGGDYQSWISINPDKSVNRWEHNPYFGYGGGGCYRFLNFGNTYNERDQLISPSYNLKKVSSPVLSFKMAYAERGGAPTDELSVWTSNNCGQTWTLRKSWKGAAITSAGLFTETFIPNKVDEWQTYFVPLSTVATATNLRIRFQFISGSPTANNLYLDEINIGTALGLDNLMAETGFSVYPNPTTDAAVAEFYVPKTTDVTVSVYDLTGKLVQVPLKKKMNQGETQVAIALDNYTSGLYTIRLDMDGQSIFKKLIVE